MLVRKCCDNCEHADLRKGAWYVCTKRSYIGGMRDEVGPPVCKHDPSFKPKDLFERKNNETS